uniref:Putative ovule protein n=1 Tax=Solanum chacoense TaxID=4108 RepID=A0A0V0HV61_SOLCH
MFMKYFREQIYTRTKIPLCVCCCKVAIHIIVFVTVFLFWYFNLFRPTLFLVFQPFSEDGKRV